MKKYIIIPVLIILIATLYSCNNTEKKLQMKERTITVIGSAEKYITPDEIYFLIGIEEYWEEEFDYNADYNDYKTKIPIDTIENQLMKTLTRNGITKEDVKVENVGNYWRYWGRDLKISKRLKIKLNDYNTIEQILTEVNTKGVNYMRIDKESHSKLEEFRKEVKKDALKAAEEKAGYLLETLDKEVGEIVSIKEINNDINRQDYYWGWYRDSYMSNSNASNRISNFSSDDFSSNSELEFKIRFEIEAEFEIE